MKKMLVGIIFIIFSVVVSAAETYNVCATYSNTGKKYKVEATVLDGSELNQKTMSGDYDNWSKYAVIFWGPGQATIIKLDFSPGGVLSMFGTSGRDQRGYLWELSTSTTFCF